jgi:hypothetical protein
MIKPPRTLGVQIDTHENKDLVFPATLNWHAPNNLTYLFKIGWFRRKLDTFDYTATTDKGIPYEHNGLLTTAVETKRSIRELYNNTCRPGRDKVRFRNVLERMAREIAYPAVVVECSTAELFRPTREVRNPPEVFDALVRQLTLYRVPLLWLPPTRTPRETGELVLRWMLANIYHVHWNERTQLQSLRNEQSKLPRHT